MVLLSQLLLSLPLLLFLLSLLLLLLLMLLSSSSLNFFYICFLWHHLWTQLLSVNWPLFVFFTFWQTGNVRLLSKLHFVLNSSFYSGYKEYTFSGQILSWLVCHTEKRVAWAREKHFSTEVQYVWRCYLTRLWIRPISSALARGVTVWYKNIVRSSGLNHCWPLLLLLLLLLVLAPTTGGSARASTLNDGWMGTIDLKIQMHSCDQVVIEYRYTWRLVCVRCNLFDPTIILKGYQKHHFKQGDIRGYN